LSKLKDWRGSSTRLLEAQPDNLAALVRQLRPKLCVMDLPGGATACRFLGSARSQWRTVIPSGVMPLGTETGRTGVSQGWALGVTLTATCQECKRHSVTSITLSKDVIGLLSLKSLALSPPAGIFISWRLEIGNQFRPGLTAS